MATESVATLTAAEIPSAGSEHELWLGNGDVLSITLNRESKGFPPTADHIQPLHYMLQGLARAAKCVVDRAGDVEVNEFNMQPVSDIADAIILLSQLAEGVRHEISREGS